MQRTFCDCCGTAIEAHDPTGVSILFAYKRYNICLACSAGIVEMLKDMRVLRDRAL